MKSADSVAVKAGDVPFGNSGAERVEPRRVTVRAGLFAVAVLFGWLFFAETSEVPGNDCRPPATPHLVLETAEGPIDIELLPEAAPEAVQRLIRLAEGPVFDPGIADPDPTGRVPGYFDGLEFDLAYPHASLATSLRPPPRSVLIPTRIDARALGLDERRIVTGAEANRVWQFELFPYQAGVPSDDELHPRMREWLARWDETKSADFLIGESYREVNEALGYEYAEGLASRPNTRGAVALEPFDRTRSTPRLVILLEDAPHFDGRRMVVGRVASGLEIVDAISARPLIPARQVKNRPLVPVKILEAQVICRSPDGPSGLLKGVE